MSSNHEFWLDILSYIDRIESIEQSDENAIAQLKSLLDTLDVSYDRCFNPADNFEAYLLVRLCSAINSHIV